MEKFPGLLFSMTKKNSGCQIIVILLVLLHVLAKLIQGMSEFFCIIVILRYTIGKQLFASEPSYELTLFGLDIVFNMERWMIFFIMVLDIDFIDHLRKFYLYNRMEYYRNIILLTKERIKKVTYCATNGDKIA
jgi:hypothetical protein